MERLSACERDAVAAAAAAPMLAHTRQWAMVNSGTANLAGLASVAAMLRDAFATLPGEPVLVAPAPVTSVAPDGTEQALVHGHHLVLRVRPNASRRVLLTGHMDTVYGAGHVFQALSDRDDGTINGPGVADMKGGIAVMLAALHGVEAAGAAFGYDVMINSDEETGSASSAALIAELARGKVAALTYEPAALPDGTLAGARPGSGNFSFVVTGRAAHAGRNPQDGRNALLAAADLALRLAALRGEGLSVNPARIDGGGPNNVVPDHAILRVNFRPATPEREIHARAAMANIVTEVTASHNVGITVHGGFGRAPKTMTREAQSLFELVKQAGDDLDQHIAWAPSGGVCDGNNIAACGVPVVDTMGVLGGAIHSADEYLIVDSLAERAMLSTVTLLRLGGER